MISSEWPSIKCEVNGEQPKHAEGEEVALAFCPTRPKRKNTNSTEVFFSSEWPCTNDEVDEGSSIMQRGGSSSPSPSFQQGHLQPPPPVRLREYLRLHRPVCWPRGGRLLAARQARSEVRHTPREDARRGPGLPRAARPARANQGATLGVLAAPPPCLLATRATAPLPPGKPEAR